VTSSSRSNLARWTRVLGVGLDPITGRALQLARRDDLTPDPRRRQGPIQAEPGRSGLIHHRHRTWQFAQPGQDVLMRRSQSGLDDLARDAIDRRRNNRPGVHVKPHARTLSKQPGPPTNVG
jgi:hypothetical protein